ncbi:HlyD family secretion protein [Aliivibrio finisterrensis]|uniref:HlyD family secretion protein n=1 Tax=Aliivibrio finisterrensis TaxID=511998 RepID=A0A4Q5KXZ9_9GAMM|nr:MULTISPECIES: efflux RND transporter periplasmic adaptor subunit [Aliivibrio]MDD9177286.1 biotin/lipoyl-binding protein [Aliivibrio sp. A6]RYU54773.1 HlyD family secretion protein [Aliivibrio finisterrensis]RYU56447.1 HlyD family secretion protein [Aliivibrio finisterrensis]RYU61568.1 HlyD family secretion protein [Aliivibrio finisterrensis]RYU66843.1 HlyD family secretion protein [Aliivibrio finisterrensis]
MLEGLAVWALFIYLLRMVGMPWNKFTQGFAYIGGGSWLLFVWAGLLNFTPMDLSGGSVVQSPHIQLRPASTQIKGVVTKIYVEPNQEVTKGQLVYEIDDEIYQIALNKAIVSQEASAVGLEVANQNVKLARQAITASESDIVVSQKQIEAKNQDLKYKKLTLQRYVEQNRKVKNTITQSALDEQGTLVSIGEIDVASAVAQLDKAKLANEKALLDLDNAKLGVKAKESELASAKESVAQAQWNLDNTKVYAPADGYVTNFILREGQYIGAVPRMQMYTNEKYVLMRVNHQAIRNVTVGRPAEFSSAVYPGKVFVAEVEGIVEATGEAQGNLLGRETNVRQTTGLNVNNKHHFVRLKLEEGEGYDIPVGSVGLAWISGEKPIGFMAFLDVIRGIIIRMKSQIYFFYSL